jgi:CheY-like chemotaxis protein
MVLEPMGIQVEEFASVQTLMDGVDRGHPQLIFLDISLEWSDAVEALSTAWRRWAIAARSI